jgi:hypothetical protein
MIQIEIDRAQHGSSMNILSGTAPDLRTAHSWLSQAINPGGATFKQRTETSLVYESTYNGAVDTHTYTGPAAAIEELAALVDAPRVAA